MRKCVEYSERKYKYIESNEQNMWNKRQRKMAEEKKKNDQSSKVDMKTAYYVATDIMRIAINR